MKERIYHPYNLWEDHKHGFYGNYSGETKKEKLETVIKFFSDPDLVKTYMHRVCKEWRYSCEHNLTNSSMNKIAYLGQAAVCLYNGTPSTLTMENWRNVPKEFQDIANQIAQDTLEIFNYA